MKLCFKLAGVSVTLQETFFSCCAGLPTGGRGDAAEEAGRGQR